MEAEFPAVTFITIIVMKHWLFSLFFWQSSAGVADLLFSPNFGDQQKPLVYNLAIAILSVIAYLFTFFLVTGWRCIRIIKHFVMMEAAPAGIPTAF